MQNADNAQIPWAQFADAIGQARLKPTPADIDAIFEGAKEQSGLSDLVLSHQLDIWSRRFGETRAQIIKTSRIRARGERQKLNEELEFMRANRLVKEEDRILREAEALVSVGRERKRERESYEMRWAREVLAKANLEFETPQAEDLARRADRLTPEQDAAKIYRDALA